MERTHFLAALAKDPLQNMAMVQMERLKNFSRIVSHGTAAALISKDEALIMVTAMEETDLTVLLSQMDQEQLKRTVIYVAKLSLKPIVEQFAGKRHTDGYLQFTSPFDTLTPMTCPLPFYTISLEDAPFIYAHYGKGKELGYEYILSRIQDGPGLKAVAEDGSIAGFILTHEEGSLGMLEVLPKYRGKGIGPALEYAIAKEMDKRGLLVYSNVVEGNLNSIRIHQKLGFTLCKETVAWLDW